MSAGVLRIYYYEPMIQEVHPIPSSPGSHLEVQPSYPTVARIIISLDEEA